MITKEGLPHTVITPKIPRLESTMAITQMPLLENKIKEDSIVEIGNTNKENALKQQVAIKKDSSKFPKYAPTVASIAMPWNQNLEDPCVICVENLRNDNYGILYPCRHVFCQDCITKIKATMNFICPLCRSNIRWTPSYKHLSRYMIALIATVIMICFLASCFILVYLMILPV